MTLHLLPLAPSANRRPASAPSSEPNRATVYTRGGETLRVPLRPAPAGAAGCAGHPELQVVRWLQRRAAAEPGFPARVRSVLLVVSQGGCPLCRGALQRFLNRFRLDTTLRVVRTNPHPAGCRCGCRHCRAQARPGLDRRLAEAGLQREDSYPPLPSPGIPEGDGQGPSVGNSLHATAHAARRAAEAEAARRNAASPKVNARFRYRVAHHGAKQPLDAPHYHVIDEQGRQVSGHFFYGRQPIRAQKKDRPTAPPYDRHTPYPGADPATSYSQYRTEWHGARANKAEGRQRRRLQKGYELEAAGW
ncbi:hypothetical protein E5K00_05135 [Hymenobacter aquaticus]|uniref:Uncharacterized protein n=1 Tax=Hymenobacter aquaticus TaxID=1867101 RepID=A0A4Z0Q3K2_9BACT|nr:hypothetical protein [Hymenobacter aquaticus]TGE24600.1 hypothetical protein E5K00_05135 [Hymenobacter aquaticus]